MGGVCLTNQMRDARWWRGVTELSLDWRFWMKVLGDGEPDQCWPWGGRIANSGYGQFGPGGGANAVFAHRWAYESLIAKVPEGLVLDHLCKNKPCVNPWHLEPVTHAENMRRWREQRAAAKPVWIQAVLAA